MISADSHVVEPPALFDDYLDPAWRDHAPRLVSDGEGGQCYQVPGSRKAIGLGLAASAGRDAPSLNERGTAFADIRTGAWLAEPRLADQDLDGVTVEILYPTVGLFLLNHVNRDFVAAVMSAYNTWLAEFCSNAPDRLIGCGVSAVLSPADAVKDLRRIRDAGLGGVLVPLEPSIGGYTDADYDVFWSAAQDLDLPVTFHALPPTRKAPVAGRAAPALLTMWEAQELLTGLLCEGVLHRHPDVRVVFAEFDAGWVPHLGDRLDRYFTTHRQWLDLTRIDRPPSDYLRRSVHFTFQDDRTALQLAEETELNLMWASDFPHAESTWPHSRSVAEVGRFLCSPAAFEAAFGGRARDLYRLV